MRVALIAELSLSDVSNQSVLLTHLVPFWGICQVVKL